MTSALIGAGLLGGLWRSFFYRDPLYVKDGVGRRRLVALAAGDGSRDDTRPVQVGLDALGPSDTLELHRPHYCPGGLTCRQGTLHMASTLSVRSLTVSAATLRSVRRTMGTQTQVLDPVWRGA